MGKNTSTRTRNNAMDSTGAKKCNTASRSVRNVTYQIGSILELPFFSKCASFFFTVGNLPQISTNILLPFHIDFLYSN